MRIAPLSPTRSPAIAARRRLPFTADLRLSAMIASMITTNALAAFSQDVSRTGGVGAATPVRDVQTASGRSAASALAGPQRTLGAVPPAPSQAPPRGSLLDLRV
ncbi:hypothetical protein C8P66_111111 [Humitalea rosea]|uniref:Uncharacterized protein n=1 Tax=Humitalea rosea TaxID=990373 RepID=A0A2W7IGH1_9PROT|nr:hypothetical protein [Humitalea rosea]PZW45696.1 hypothetical protein C8P66_111111 [Humitalea rosea]